MEIFTSSHFFSPRNALRQFLIILFFAVYFWASSMEKILIILACLALNAVLAATEMAFVTVGKHRLRDLARSGNNEAKRILTLRDKPERTLSVIQIGITLVASIAAATGGAGAVPITNDSVTVTDLTFYQLTLDNQNAIRLVANMQNDVASVTIDKFILIK